MNAMQRLAKAIMGAVAVIPVAALLIGVSFWIDPEGNGNTIATILSNSGNAVLNNLGWIFAVALGYGLSKDSNGAAALSGFLGFATILALIGPDSIATFRGIDPDALTGQEAVDWAAQGWDAIAGSNVLLGILVGVLASWVYNHFHGTRLPEALSFFSGRRLVPILTAVFSIVLAGALYVVWPFVYSNLFSFGAWIQGMGAVGAGIYGVVNRLLFPVGLHHALNQIFWFDIAGINDIGKYLGGVQTIDAAAAATSAQTCPGLWDGTSCIVEGIIGRYQGGFYPIFLFGLPAAALAIYLRAKPAKKKLVGSLMLAGALSSFITGVAEPLEFSFIFVAPLLFVIHALLTGLSVFLAAQFHWTAGFGFSAGLVDFTLTIRNPLAHEWWMLLLIGVLFFIAYFAIFYFLIGALNLKTPGREDGEAGGDVVSDVLSGSQNERTARQAALILHDLGGGQNVDTLDHCTTRLRIGVHDGTKIDEDALEHRTGAAGMIRLSETGVQVIIGNSVQFVFDEMNRQIAGGTPPEVAEAIAPVLEAAPTPTEEPALVGASAAGSGAGAAGSGAEAAPGSGAGTDAATPGTPVRLTAPAGGRVVPLDEVPDPAFAQGMVGKGFAVVPEEEASTFEVTAPADGHILQVFPTGHAFLLTTDEGLGVLVHIGLDTVELKGEGFEKLVQKGAAVTAGDPIIRVDATAVRKAGYDLTIPVVVPDKKQVNQVIVDKLGATLLTTLEPS